MNRREEFIEHIAKREKEKKIFKFNIEPLVPIQMIDGSLFTVDIRCKDNYSSAFVVCKSDSLKRIDKKIDEAIE